ncbi:hypothetical protein Tco_0745034 [Tanacetum coccineum]
MKATMAWSAFNVSEDTLNRFKMRVLGSYWKRIQRQTLNMIPGLLAVRYEKKMKFVEQPIGHAPDSESIDPDTIDKYYESVNLEQEVACLILSSMSPDLQRTLEKYIAFDMMKELKTMFEEQAKQELFETIKVFHACKQEDAWGKTLVELHAILKLHEKGIPKKAETPVVLAIREGKIHKDKKKPQGKKGKAKGKNKLAYAPKTKISPPPKRDNPAKNFICHHYKEVVTGGGIVRPTYEV